MSKRRFILERLSDGGLLPMDSFPGNPIVEIAGDKRVLIENHMGVKAYGREKITVSVTYGSLSVCGCNLELLKMTREQLVIQGRIDAIMLQRRG